MWCSKHLEVQQNHWYIIHMYVHMFVFEKKSLIFTITYNLNRRVACIHYQQLVGADFYLNKYRIHLLSLVHLPE